MPLTNDLIIAAFETRGYKYFTDSDGDIGGYWDENLFYFFRMGNDHEVLVIRVRSQRTFTTDDIPRLFSFCNSWNDDKLWPKAYVHVADGDGGNKVYVYGELATDLEHGVTPEQLDQLLLCGISSGCELAAAVESLEL